MKTIPAEIIVEIFRWYPSYRILSVSKKIREILEEEEFMIYFCTKKLEDVINFTYFPRSKYSFTEALSESYCYDEELRKMFKHKDKICEITLNGLDTYYGPNGEFQKFRGNFPHAEVILARNSFGIHFETMKNITRIEISDSFFPGDMGLEHYPALKVFSMVSCGTGELTLAYDPDNFIHRNAKVFIKNCLVKSWDERHREISFINCIIYDGEYIVEDYCTPKYSDLFYYSD